MALSENVIGIRLSGDAKQLQQALQQGTGYIEGFAKESRAHMTGLSSDMDKAGASAGGLSNSLKGAFLGGGAVAGIFAVKSILGDLRQELIQTQIQADKMRNGLNFAVGAGNVASEMAFVSQSAKSMGLELNSAGEQYTKLAAAARGTSLEGKATREIFTSIAQASTVMGLSAQETQGALLAVTQMISKGKVQAEELRGQLGERLPGAFQIAARAMGVTTGELDKMLESGQVLTTDFLPKFASQLSMEVAPQVEEASKSMQASVNRMANSWTELKRAFNEAGVSDGVAKNINILQDGVDSVSESMRKARENGSGFFGQMAAAGGAVASFLNPLNMFDYQMQSVGGRLQQVEMESKKADKQMADFQARLAQNPDSDWLKINIVMLQRWIDQLKEARGVQLSLMGNKVYTGGDEARAGRSGADAAREQEAVKRSIAEVTQIKQKLSGVDNDYLPTLNKLQTARERGIVTEQEYVRLVSDLATKNYTKPHAEKQATAYDTLSSSIAKNLAMANEELASGAKLSAADRMRQEDISRITDAYSKRQITAKQWIDLTAKANSAADARALADSTTETNRYVQAINEKIAAAQLDIETTGNLTEGQKMAAKFTQDLADGTLKLSEADAIARTAALERLIAIEKTNAAQKELQKQYDKEDKQIQDSIDAMNKKAMAIEDEVALYGKSEEAIKELTIARLRDEQAKQMSYGDEVRVAKIEAEIEAIKRLAKAQDALKDKDDGAKAAKKAGEEWKRTSDEINRTLTDSLMRAFENGEGYGKAFGKTIEAMFKTMVLRPIISMVMTPVSGMINGVLGSIGIPGAGGGQGMTMSGLVNGANTANNLYNTGNSLYTVGSQYIGGTMSGSNALGTMYANTTGGGLDALLSTNGAYGTAAPSSTGVMGGAGTSMMGFIPLLLAAWGMNKDAFRVSSTGDSTSQFDASGKVINRRNQLFGGANPISIPSIVNGVAVTSPGASTYNPADTATIDGRSQEYIDAQNLRMNTEADAHFLAISATADKYTEGLNAAYLAAAKNLGVGAVSTNITFGTNDTRGGGGARLGVSAGSKSFDSGDISLSDADLKLAASRAILTALEGSELPKWMSGVFDGVDAAKLDQAGIDAAIKSATDLKAAYTALQQIPGVNLTDISFETLNSIKGVAAELTAVDTTFAALGYTLLDVSAAGGAAAAGLVSAMGGLEAFNSQMSSYYQNFYSATEQRDNTVNSIVGQLSAAGITVTADQVRNATRADVRSFVDQYAGNIKTPEGQAQYAAAVKAANQFAGITPNTPATAPSQVAQVGSSGGGGGGGGGGASAASEIASAWQAITDSIWGEVKRIRGLIEGTGDDAFAAAQARFAIATAQTRAGDQDAGKALPELAQNVTRLAELNASTLLELKMVQAQTAGSLMDTRAIIAAQYGISLPSFDVGTNLVPQDMIAQIHKGEAIVPAAYNPALNGAAAGVGDWGAAYAAMAAAMEKMATRLEAIETNTGSTADSSLNTTRILTRSMPDGNTIEVRVVT